MITLEVVLITLAGICFTLLMLGVVTKVRTWLDARRAARFNRRWDALMEEIGGLGGIPVGTITADQISTNKIVIETDKIAAQTIKTDKIKLDTDAISIDKIDKIEAGASMMPITLHTSVQHVTLGDPEQRITTPFSEPQSASRPPLSASPPQTPHFPSDPHSAPQADCCDSTQ